MVLGEHHQARDVVARAVLPDAGDDLVEAREARAPPPEHGRKRARRAEKGDARAAVRPARLYTPRTTRKPSVASWTWRTNSRQPSTCRTKPSWLGSGRSIASTSLSTRCALRRWRFKSGAIREWNRLRERDDIASSKGPKWGRHERGRVGSGHHVPHRHAAVGLLEREVAQARENERKLLLVVWPPRRLARALDEHDDELARGRARQRPHGVGQLVVGHEEPPSAGLVHAACIEAFAEDAHSVARF